MSGWHCRDCGQLNNEFGGCDCDKKRNAELFKSIMMPKPEATRTTATPAHDKASEGEGRA